jgi:hypothetical protein
MEADLKNQRYQDTSLLLVSSANGIFIQLIILEQELEKYSGAEKQV